MSSELVDISNDSNESLERVVVYLLNAIKDLIENQNKDYVTIGLTGGSLIGLLSKAAVKNKDQFLKYSSKLKFLFGDERFVSFTDNDSTYKCYVDAKFFQELNIPAENIFAIKADAENVDKCADDYEDRIKGLLNANHGFDILILGHGPDGHICSLFPGHKLFTENQTRIVVPISDSPKPPPRRVTLTLPIVNNSTHVLFCSYGEGKAQIISEIVKDKNRSLPAACVEPKNGTVKWFIDKGAAKLL